MAFVPKRIGIVGLGLMGGSFAKAYASAGWEVFGCNRSREITELALIETLTGELDDAAIPGCELIILAGYPQACVDWLEAHAALIAEGALVIDVAGVKRWICERCDAIAAAHDFTFIGCHPMAGTQYSGFAYAHAHMFAGAPMVVVPPALDDIERADAIDRLRELLSPCGFGSFTLASAEEHDRMIAYTSQLAHVVSNAYVKSPTAQAHRGFSAGSYRDLTRVAQLNAPMWTELILDNADFAGDEVDLLIENLTAYRDAIRAGDAEALEALFAEGDALKRAADGSRRG